MAKSEIPSYRLYRERSGESGDFWIHCETIPARTHLHKFEIAPHRHDAFFQLFVVTTGTGEMLTGDSISPFAAPCALFVPPGATHGFRFDRDIDGLVMTALADRLATLAASGSMLAAFRAETRVVPLQADPEPVVAAIRRIMSEVAGHEDGSGMLLEALVTDAVISLARVWRRHAPDVRTEADGSDRLARLDALIGVHFRELRTANFYAERLGVSAAHLNRIAREARGATVHEMVARRRLDAARRDLILTPTPAGSIALSLGFQDPAYFNRFFRKRTGLTPGAFRRQERARLSAG